MKYDLKEQAEKIHKRYAGKRRWLRIVCVLACITLLFTTYALMMPAITMTRSRINKQAADGNLSRDDNLPTQNGSVSDSGGGTVYNLSDNPTIYNLTTAITVNDAVLSSDMTLESGDEFSITVDWYLPTGSMYSSSDTFIYNLPTGTVFALTDTSGILYTDDRTTEYGSYSISNNLLTVRYTDAFLALSNRHSNVRADGAINITSSTTVTEDGYTVNIPGLSSVTIHLKTDTGMTIKKSSVKRIVETADTHETWVDYTITLTANGLNNNVRLTDYFYIEEANPHKIGTTVPVASLNGTALPIDTEAVTASVTSDKGNTITSGGAVQSGDPHRTTTAVVSQMKSGDVLTITYSAKLVSEPTAVSHSYYGDVKIYNTVSAESEQCSKISDRVDDTLRVTYIDKDGGNLSGDATKTYWRIYVCGGEYSTLTVKDILPTNCHIYPTDETAVTVYDAIGKSANGLSNARSITFAELKSGYEVDFPESGWVMFYYECDADADCTVTNTAQIAETNKRAEYSFSHGTVSATDGKKQWLSAERVTDTMSADYFDTRILNQIEISVGTESQSVTDFYFRDMTNDIGGGANIHHFPNNAADTIVSIEVWDSDANDYIAVDDDRFVISLAKTIYGSQVYNDSLYFRFKDNNVIVGRYRIKYYTLVEHENLNLRSDDCLITNTLYWSNGTSTESGGGEKQRWRAYSYLGKENKSAVSSQNDLIIWKIGGLGLNYNLYDRDTNVTMRYENFRQYSTVVDTLPAGLEFVAAAYGNPNPTAGGADNVIPTITVNSDGTTTLEFPMYTDTSTVQDLYILTRYSGNYEELTEKKSFTNTVKIGLRNAAGGTVYEPTRMKNITASTAIQPPIVADKTCTYTTDTAPYAEFQVIINSAASNMIPESSEKQSFELQDIMGSALSLDESTMLINGEPLSSYPELTLKVTGGGSAFVLSGLQDETAYTITYKALVLLGAGETFSNEDAANEITIPGIEIPERSTTRTVISGQVYGSSGTAGGTNGLVRVHKTDDRSPSQPVENAGFTIYRIGTVAEVFAMSALPTEVTDVMTTITTDAEGYTDFVRIDYGVVYGIKETTVPSGYSDTSDGAITYFAYKSWDMTSLPNGVQDLTNSPVKTFDFVNRASALLTITKAVDGSSAANEDFPFTLTSSEAMKSGDGYTLSDDGKTATFSLKNGESVTLTVYTGSEIRLTETAHNGYIVLIKEGTQLLANGDSAAFEISSTKDRTVTVHNTPGVELPSTGGMGTHWITVAGLLFMTFAIVGGYRLRCKREGRLG